jgi:hypothetical protein
MQPRPMLGEATPAKRLLGFLARFALIAGILVLPWPGVKEGYAHVLRQTGQWLAGRDNPKWFVLFERNPDPHLDTLIYLGNRKQLAADSTIPTARIRFTSRYVGYLPTALLAALVLATPLPLKRRMCALGLGLLLMQLFLGLLILIMIFNQCSYFPTMGLIQLGSFQEQVVRSVYDIFVRHLGARMTVPVLVWILICFRRDDLERILGAGMAREY